MNRIITLLVIAITFISIQSSAQSQSWQWIKAGGGNADNAGINNKAAGCKIAGCDARGNVYALGDMNGGVTVFDTFHSPGNTSTAYKNFILFSYDCSGHMRWAKQIGDVFGYPIYPGVVTDVSGYTYLSGVFYTAFQIGDSIIDANVPQNKFTYLIKMDSAGKIVWVKNYGRDTTSLNSTSGYCQGMRIGSSGNLWMNCVFDSSYIFTPSLRTNRKGRYQVEVNPNNGNVLGGYYTSNGSSNSNPDFDRQYDIDNNENYYEMGTLSATLWYRVGDTLYLNGHTFTPDSTLASGQSYIYSLDKHGNFRYFTTSTTKGTTNAFTCRYDLRNDRLISTFNMDSGVVFGGDSIRYNRGNYNLQSSLVHNIPLIFCTGPNGNVLWHKLITSSNVNYIYAFRNTPTANYISSDMSDGFMVYDKRDTIRAGTGNCVFNCSTFYRQISRIDRDGNLTASYVAPLGTANINDGDNVTSGAVDWRGNFYMGGSITNYMVLPNGDSVANTDPGSGNFFIAKIGTSDCSCPSPGTQFTETVHGDTVIFYGSSTNHRDSIHWKLSDGTIITADTFTHIFAHGHTYTVTATGYNGCGTDSISRQLNLNTGISEQAYSISRLYPTPSQKEIYVEVTGAARMGLVAANGTAMWDQPVKVNTAGTYIFDMSSFAAALYYMIIEYSDGRTDVLPVVKK